MVRLDDCEVSELAPMCYLRPKGHGAEGELHDRHVPVNPDTRIFGGVRRSRNSGRQRGDPFAQRRSGDRMRGSSARRIWRSGDRFERAAKTGSDHCRGEGADPRQSRVAGQSGVLRGPRPHRVRSARTRRRFASSSICRSIGTAARCNTAAADSTASSSRAWGCRRPCRLTRPLRWRAASRPTARIQATRPSPANRRRPSR